MAEIDKNAAKGKFLIVDGNGLAYRSFYAVPVYKSALGLPINAICGFVKLLFNVIYAEAPTHVAVAFDHSALTERLLKYQGYNVQREEQPDDLAVQLPFLEDFVHLCGIRTVRMPGFEADDCIGTMVNRAHEAGLRSLIIAGDLDLLQLVRSDVNVLTMQRGLGDTVVYNEKTVESTFHLAPHQLAELRALAGDSGQSIAGIPGIGNVTASRLLSQYHSLEELYDNLDRLPTKWRNPLRENYDAAKEFLARATIRTDLPIELSIDDCKFSGIPVQVFHRVFDLLGKEFEFGSLLIERLHNMAVPELPTALPKEPLAREEAHKALKLCQESHSDISIVWLVHDNVENGVAVHVAELPIFYIHCGNGPDEVSNEEVWNYLAPIFADSERVKYIYRSQDVVSRHELLGNNVVDVSLASALLYPEMWHHRFVDICSRFGLATYDTKLLFGDGKVAWDLVPFHNKMVWTVRAAEVMHTLGPLIVATLKERGMWDIYREVDIPFARSMGKLINCGMRFDAQETEKVRTIIIERMEELRRGICEAAGYQFDIEDDKDLGELLFAKLGLLVPTRPKAGEEISTEILISLEGQHPIVTEIRKYRELADFIKIFVQQFLVERKLEFDVDGSLFNVALMGERRIQALNKAAVEGPALIVHRLAAVVGNILSGSTRTPLHKAVQNTLLSNADDRCVVAVYLDQIILRVLAHLAHDTDLEQAIATGNVMREMAMVVMGKEDSELTPIDVRTMAIMTLRYMGPNWMARRLTVSVEEATEKLRAFDTELARRFPTSWNYMQDQLARAKRYECLTTLAGRSYSAVETNSRMLNIREASERRAMTYAVECSVADIQRAIIARIYQEFEDEVYAVPAYDGFILNTSRATLDSVMGQIVAICKDCTFGIEVPVHWHSGSSLGAAVQGLV